MPRICRCQAYGYVQHMYFSLFPRADPKKDRISISSPSLSKPQGVQLMVIDSLSLPSNVISGVS